MTQARQILLSRINGEAQHKLDLSRSTISGFPNLKFGSWGHHLIRVSFLTTLVIYKAYFRSHYVRKQRPKTHILCMKQLRLYAIGFCNQVLLDLYCWWSEELCCQQQSFKLLELVTDWRFVQQRKEDYYNIKSN